MTKDKIEKILNEINLPYHKPSSGHLNVRCPVCKDSQKSLKKRRGWFLFNDDDSVTYYCHNCSYSASFQHFLKDNYEEVYLKYANEFLFDKQSAKLLEKIEARVNNSSELIHEDLRYILNNIAFPLMQKQPSMILENMRKNTLKYVVDRKIPQDRIKEMWAGFSNYTDEDGTKFYLQNRLIIPFYSDNTEIYAFQGRLLYEGVGLPKYITYKRSNETKIFNFFNVDPKKRVYVQEGPIDAFFVNNCVATAGTVSVRSIEVALLKAKFKDLVFVFDNDKAGHTRALSFLEAGFKVFLWPPEWRQFKDMNMVAVNLCLTSDAICDIIDHNVVEGNKGILIFKMKLRR